MIKHLSDYFPKLHGGSSIGHARGSVEIANGLLVGKRGRRDKSFQRVE